MSCNLTCPAGYYGDQVIRKCLSCYFTCKTCTGPYVSDCQSCIDNTYSLKNPTNQNYECITACPNNYYANSGSKSCESCGSSCYSC